MARLFADYKYQHYFCSNQFKSSQCIGYTVSNECTCVVAVNNVSSLGSMCIKQQQIKINIFPFLYGTFKMACIVVQISTEFCNCKHRLDEFSWCILHSRLQLLCFIWNYGLSSYFHCGTWGHKFSLRFKCNKTTSKQYE